MMKHEFEERIGAELTPEQYEIVERVYMWHPSIPNVGGKDKIAELYKLGGMDLIEDMNCRCISLEARYITACQQLEETIRRKRVVLDKITELQKQINEQSQLFDELTAQTEELQKWKESVTRGN